MGSQGSGVDVATEVSRVWWRRHLTEITGNLLAVLLLPWLASWLWATYADAVRQFGLGELISRLAGQGGWTDIGWEVASAVGLMRDDYSAYDSLAILHPLIGMKLEFVDLSAHSHPPTSLPLGLPLVPFDYSSWLPYWMVIALLMMAWSMRLLGVPAHIAYPLAVVIALSVPGRWGLVSSYPLSALLVSWAWHARNRWKSAGLAYGLFGATRGVGLLLLIYPLVRKQWRTVIAALAVVIILLGIAVVLEGDVIQQWLTTSRASIEVNMQRQDLLTPGAVLRRYGLPEFVAWISAALIGFIAWRRGNNLFWILNWVILAISPIAWFHTLILGIPLLVVMWKSGKLGQTMVLVVAAGAMTQLVDPYVTLVFSISWMIFIVASALWLLRGTIAAKRELDV